MENVESGSRYGSTYGLTPGSWKVLPVGAVAVAAGVPQPPGEEVAAGGGWRGGQFAGGGGGGGGGQFWGADVLPGR